MTFDTPIIVSRTLLKIFLLGAMTLVGGHAAAQTTFHHLTTADGLSHNTVMDLLQDHKGFLWLGTADGLNRYDGESFQVFRHSVRDGRSLSSNEVKCLLEDREHRLWVGTSSGGLNRLDSTGVRFDRFVRTADGLDISSVTITDLAEDDAGIIWAATYGEGLLRIDPKTGQISQLTPRKNNLASDYIHRICTDQSGNLWMASQSGMVMRLPTASQQAESMNLAPILQNEDIISIKSDSQNRVWVGTQSHGLWRCEPGSKEFALIFYHPGVEEGVNKAQSLYEDANGRFWLGTDDGVIMSENGDFKQITHFTHDPGRAGSLSTHATFRVRGDRDGNIWIGTWEGGLNVAFARPAPFGVYTYRPGQSNSLLARTVTTLAADSAGNVWLGSTKGLSYLDRKTNTYRHFRHQPGDPGTIPGNDITYLNLLSEKALLVNTWKKGTVIVDPATGKVRRRLTFFGSAQVHCVVPATGTKAWISTKRGERWLIDRQTTPLMFKKSLGRTPFSLTSLLQTSDGTLWSGTFADGLVEQPPGSQRLRRHTVDRKSGGLNDNHITCLFEDKRAQLWVGTMNGLHRYDASTGSFDLLSSDDGIPNDAIMSISQDANGTLWVATNDGLCQMKSTGEVLRTFRRDDGLAGNDFTERAVGQSPDGTLFWGGKHGLTVFQPSHERPGQTAKSAPPVPVYLTGLKLFNRPVSPGSEGSPLKRSLADTEAITLRHDQSVITLDFAAVLFQAHRNVRYAYMLEGFEEEWNYVGTQHSATYTNQSPGTYTFRAKASLTDNFDDASEATLRITILPPWYRTNWAYGIYCLLIAGLLLGMRRVIQIREEYKTQLRAEHLETEKARELDRLRSGFFTNISHEFRTPFTLILTPLEQFLTDRATNSRRPQYRTMHRNAQRLLRLINQLLDLSKLESGLLQPEISRQDIVTYLRRIAETFTSQAQRQGVSLRIETDPETFSAWFDADIVEKVLYNLLANALKFTPDGGTVTVRCQILDRDDAATLTLEVEDTGAGIAPDQAAHIFERFYQAEGQNQPKKAGTGIGLALTRELVELHRGNIQVESQPGLGTAFVVSLPVHVAVFPINWRAASPTHALNPTGAVSEPNVGVLEGSVKVSSRHSKTDEPLVLVVEDHDDLRQYLVGSFQKKYRVLSASNGSEALLKAQAEIPDLVVSDWLMPDMDGVQLCQKLKSDERTSHVPIILLTSKSSTESKVQGLGAGVDDYVTKPFNMDVLLSRMKNLIEGRRLLRAKYSQSLREPAKKVPESPEEIFLQKILACIHKYLADPALNVQLLEREMGMSNTQLYRKLRALTGKGANELIRSIRLEKAAQLLHQGNRQVAETAYEVGFSDPNYFTRVFRKEFGVTPGEYGKKEEETKV